MPSKTIVIQSHSPINRTEIYETQCFITYTLADTLKFKEPHYARLLWLYGGVSTNLFFVYADFVKRQNVDGVLLPYLGCRTNSTVSGWVPLASNHISQTGLITVIKTRGASSIAQTTIFTVAIEIAPESLIYGTQS